MFEGLQVVRMVIHEVFRRAAGGDAIAPNFSTSLSPLPPEGTEAFKARVVDVMGRRGRSTELAITQSIAGSAVSIAQSLLEADNARTFVARSRSAAELLTRAQTNRTMPGGILVIFSGIAGEPARPLVGYLKAEPHSGFVRNTDGDRMTLEYVREVLLSQASRFYKIGIFFAPARANANFPRGWQAFVYDDQISASARDSASRYFYEAFLGCAFPEDAARVVRDFHDHTKEFIRTRPMPEEEKVGLFNALVTYLKVDVAQTIQVTEFGGRYLPPAIADDYERYMIERGVPDGVVAKDLREVESMLRLRKIKFSRNLAITGPAEDFEEMVTVTAIDGDPGAAGDRPQWTQVVIKDHIRSQQ
jgi:hypothetical protein